jgi:hypothetical protein
MKWMQCEADSRLVVDRTGRIVCTAFNDRLAAKIVADHREFWEESEMNTATDFEFFLQFKRLDRMHRIAAYLAGQYSIQMTPAEARAHFAARVIVARAQREVYEEAQLALGVAI